jgi:hypothetical protein
MTVPAEATVDSLENDHVCSMPSSYNRTSTVIAIGQILYAAGTIYQTRGDQLSRYGYVAFGLTVTPYIVMSVVNLLGNLLNPEYPESYLVESQIMDEARRRGGKFPCTVGILAEKDVTFTSETAEWVILNQPIIFNGDNDGNLVVDLDSKSVCESQSTKTPDAEENQQEIITRPKVTEKESNGLVPFRVLADISTSTAASDGVRTMLVPRCGPFKRTIYGKSRKDYVIELVEPKTSGLYDVQFTNETNFERSMAVLFVVTLIVGAIPFAIIGGLSGFRPGSSTYAQRVWIMTWLSLGQAYVLVVTLLNVTVRLLLLPCLPQSNIRYVEQALRLVLLCVPGWGAFVVVGKMMVAYGNCVSLG